MRTIRVLTPRHRRWGRLLARLTRATGVHAEEAERLRVPTHLVRAEQGAPTGCNGPLDWDHAHEAARAILSSLRVDVARTVAFVRLHGAYCDCEILLNLRGLACAGLPGGCDRCRHFLELRPHWDLYGLGPAEREYLDALAPAR